MSAWAVGGALTEGYDPLEQAISELAAEGASTRWLMTAGLVAFGVLVPVWAQALGRALEEPRLRVSVTVAGLATLAVAAFPLTREGGQSTDVAHAVSAGIGYVAMAATPLIAATALRRRGMRRAAVTSAVVGGIATASLVGSLLVDGAGGLQRLGLTTVDLWYVVAATWVLRRTS